MDDLGNKIALDSPPKRIVSLAPNITEALYSIRADSLIAGVTNYCNYPLDAQNKTKIGGMIDPNYEIITSLEPDLIIMTVEGNAKQSYKALKELGMRIFVTNPRNINGIIKMINDLGAITGKVDEAKEVSEKIHDDKNFYEQLNENSDKIKCLLVISVNPLMTANRKTFINEIIELSGFKNIYHDEAIVYPMISYEDVTEKNPEYIVFPTDTSDVNAYEKYINEISKNLSSTKAVKEKKIILADSDLLFRPGPRVTNAVKLLRSKIN
jgi:iron complex transport system substrate-binding protein